MIISSFFITLKTLLRDKKKPDVKTPPGDKNGEYNYTEYIKNSAWRQKVILKTPPGDKKGINTYRKYINTWLYCNSLDFGKPSEKHSKEFATAVPLKSSLEFGFKSARLSK